MPDEVTDHAIGQPCPRTARSTASHKIKIH
jgi:hypothetical protein